jgi:hypothetical protein
LEPAEGYIQVSDIRKGNTPGLVPVIASPLKQLNHEKCEGQPGYKHHGHGPDDSFEWIAHGSALILRPSWAVAQTRIMIWPCLKC